MNERIRKLRKALDLTQQEFADKIGMKRNTVANYETDRNEPSSSVISLICREFNVSETWLRTGKGAMFVEVPNTPLEELATHFDLSPFDEALVQEYISLSPSTKKLIRTFFFRVLMKSTKGASPDELLKTEMGYPSAEEIEAFGEEAKRLVIEQYLSEKKPDAPASFAKESDVG